MRGTWLLHSHKPAFQSASCRRGIYCTHRHRYVNREVCNIAAGAANAVDKESEEGVVRHEVHQESPSTAELRLLSDTAPPSPSWIRPPHMQGDLLADVSGLSAEDVSTRDDIYNQELSWLAFNWRVLSMAEEESTPLYERLKFLARTAANLDEFFARRVGGLMRQRDAGAANLKKPLLNPGQQLHWISQEVASIVEHQMRILQEQVLPQLLQHGIRILSYSELSPQGRGSLNEYFGRELELLLTPIKLDPGHPFPYLPSQSLNLAVILLDPRQTERRRPQYAIVNIPSSFARWYAVSEGSAAEGASWKQGFMPVEQIIIHNLGQLFGGMTIVGAHCFRVTRNAELERHEEEAEDLLDMISDELRERRFADFVRLEVDVGMPEEVVELLAQELQLEMPQDVYHIDRLLHLGDLFSLPVVAAELPPSLFFPPWSPQNHPRLAAPHRHRNLRKHLRWEGNKWKGVRSIFSIIRDGDILVQHPYHSFASSTQRLVEEAARDPRVAAIKATLYRTSSDSPIIAALLKAAENGKQVAVLVELKARFDEARNVGFAQRLEDAGCHVAYGLVGLKTHCKLTLIVRRERSAMKQLRTYVHIGTGNYNPSTAGAYTDFGLLTCNPELGDDLVDIFKYLTGLHNQRAVGGFKRLLVANEFMRGQFLDLMDREIANAKAGKPAAVCLKVNGLDDKVMTAKIYEAAAASVRCDCIVRGVCRLRAGVPGLSANVRVVSVVGRFLEHHRVYCFLNGGAPLYFIGSADWRNRNLMRRVEVATPIYDAGLQQQLADVLALCLWDAQDAWEMLPDGRFTKPATRCEEAALAAPLLGRGVDPARAARLRGLAQALGAQAACCEMTLEEVSQQPAAAAVPSWEPIMPE